MTRKRAISATGVTAAVLLIAIYFALPYLNRARIGAHISCKSNLRQLGQALFLYAGDHQKHLPDTLEDLLRDYEITAEIYTCPSSNDEKAPGMNAEECIANMRARGLPTQLSSATTQPSRYCSYIYAGKGLTSDQLTPKTILAYEPLANHYNDGTFILFGDGHVDFVARDEAIEIVTAMIRSRGGINRATTRDVSNAGAK